MRTKRKLSLNKSLGLIFLRFCLVMGLLASTLSAEQIGVDGAVRNGADINGVTTGSNADENYPENCFTSMFEAKNKAKGMAAMFGDEEKTYSQLPLISSSFHVTTKAGHGLNYSSANSETVRQRDLKSFVCFNYSALERAIANWQPSLDIDNSGTDLSEVQQLAEQRNINQDETSNEYLLALAELSAVPANRQESFFAQLQDNMANIFRGWLYAHKQIVRLAEALN